MHALHFMCASISCVLAFHVLGLLGHATCAWAHALPWVWLSLGTLMCKATFLIVARWLGYHYQA